ncbi:MAG: RNA-binding S4 domain-containing protein [Firmicutes bacterium]|jgi:ribosome-associated protein|nr:RNA-binding S4 domain-containing protein [Bacillota bacterium]
MEVKIKSEFIKLDQFLKFSGFVDTGGIAKAIIQDGLVEVNGEVTTQRGKKLRAGDEVTIKIYDEENDELEVYNYSVLSE